MSFSTLPPDVTYCVGPGCCNEVYAPGETPLKLYASFTGIKMGTAIPGVDPPPQNRTVELDFFGNCSWQWQDLPERCDLSLNNPPSQLIFHPGAPLTYFKDFPGGDGVSWYVNDQQNPLVDDYYDGTCKVISTAAGGEEVVINALADIGMEAAAETYCDFVPVTNDITCLRFSDRNGKTNIHIKYDNS